jgi:hypothetical protein
MWDWIFLFLAKVGVFGMPQRRGGRSVTCDDCYFRQELLCALSSDSVCPTFRATVGRGRGPERPRQAQLVPLPMAQTAPFGAVSEESTFAVRDAVRPAKVLARDAIQQPPRPEPVAVMPAPAAAAAHRDPGVECIVELDEAAADLEPAVVPAQPRVVARSGGDTHRMGRVARRVAERYPNAMQLC